ncbi:hypothetical protein BC835DRAFT_1391574, partial [Cytidiella melzeri]
MAKALSTVPAASRAKWKPSAQAALVAALHKEKVEGRMVENGFKPVSWTYASAAVLEKAWIAVNAKQCKNHWAMLRARYKDLVRMRQLSGFGWNEEACQLTATADVWDAYLQIRVELDVLIPSMCGNKHIAFHSLTTSPFFVRIHMLQAIMLLLLVVHLSLSLSHRTCQVLIARTEASWAQGMFQKVTVMTKRLQ